MMVFFLGVWDGMMMMMNMFFFDYTLLMFFSVSHFGIGGLLIFGDILSQETFIQFWVFSGYG